MRSRAAAVAAALAMTVVPSATAAARDRGAGSGGVGSGGVGSGDVAPPSPPEGSGGDAEAAETSEPALAPCDSWRSEAAEASGPTLFYAIAGQPEATLEVSVTLADGDGGHADVVLGVVRRDESGGVRARQSMRCERDTWSLVAVEEDGLVARFDPPLPLVVVSGGDAASQGTIELEREGQPAAVPYRFASQSSVVAAAGDAAALPRLADATWVRVESTLVIGSGDARVELVSTTDWAWGPGLLAPVSRRESYWADDVERIDQISATFVAR
ncbi:MAG: hypothetical protein H6697_03300 [Myxococcales bacterium]|nr:hypothetical protein [Myxococcales bacterium]